MAKTPEELLGIKKPATEETLQSIDSTLKRIADILEREYSVSPLQQIKEPLEDALHRPLNLCWQPDTGREEVVIKHGKTEITINEEEISVLAEKISLESDMCHQQA